MGVGVDFRFSRAEKSAQIVCACLQVILDDIDGQCVGLIAALPKCHGHRQHQRNTGDYQHVAYEFWAKLHITETSLYSIEPIGLPVSYISMPNYW
jgi:hypothetical protein